MNKKGLQLLLIIITVLLVMAVPFLIESGAIPIKNKALAYTLIFAFMIALSFLISFVLKKISANKDSPTAKRALYDSLMHDYNSNRIEYNLARSNVNRHDIKVNSDAKKGLDIILKKGIYEISLNVTKSRATLLVNYDENEFAALADDVKKSASLLMADIKEPKELVRYSKNSMYELLIKLYKNL